VVINIYLPKQDHSSPTPDQTKSDPNPVIALPIYEPFRAAYDGHKEKLGKPTMKEEPLVNTYFGQHELEKAIWIQPLAKFVFLDFHSKWTSAEDPFPDYDLTFFNDDCNRKRFGTPKHSSPPQGGVAMLWTQDMNKWKERMGWRKWHCYYRAAYLQRFEGGYVIGPFSRSPTDKVGALVFVLTNDSEWSAEVKPNDKAPTCEMVTAVDETSDPCTSKMAPLPKR
jgi:hypothetical protein